MRSHDDPFRRTLCFTAASKARIVRNVRTSTADIRRCKASHAAPTAASRTAAPATVLPSPDDSPVEMPRSGTFSLTADARH